MRLGGPVFVGSDNIPAWVAAHKAAGYSAAYVPDLPEAKLAELVDESRKADLVLAEVGAWSNPISADDKQRKAAHDLCCTRLALADKVGARCCVNIAGSRGERWDGPYKTNLSPETFDIIVESVRQIIDAVKPTRTFYTLETMPWVFPDSAESYLKLLRTIDRKQFAVHLDVVNIVNCPARAYNTAGLIRECFGILGPHIKSCHAKDIRFSQHLTVHLDECAPGEGVIDFGTYLRELSKLDRDVPLMLEHLNGEPQYRAAVDHIRGVAAHEGLAFG